jgi:EPS-associated MarR family transcriptional regulator
MIEYRVLKELQLNPSHTQRSLAQALHISLGKVNYVLSGLMEKGIIKAKKLKNQPDKVRWQYLLTPEGIQEKIRITSDYLRRRLTEFGELQSEIESLRKEVESEATSRSSDQLPSSGAAVGRSD